MIRFAIDHAEGIRENLPADVLVREHLMGRMAAIRGMHDPAGWEEQQAARRRTAFEELFSCRQVFSFYESAEKRTMWESNACHQGI